MANYSTYTDSQLIDLLRKSDHTAFNEIYNRYSALLISFAYRSLLDRQLAKDLVQDYFADLWDKRTSIFISKNFESLIFTAVKNRILNHFKRTKVSQRYLDSVLQDTHNIDNSTDHLVRHNDLAALIEKEVAALPDKMRLVFELSRKTKMSRKEIADHMELPEENIKTNIRRALNILRGRLKEAIVLFFFAHL